MAVLDDNDPILRLTDQFSEHFKGYQRADIVAALALSLVSVLQPRPNATPPALAFICEELRQIVAEVIHLRTAAKRES